eukprot:gene22964-31270_t
MCDRSSSTQYESEPEANPIQAANAQNSNNFKTESENKTATASTSVHNTKLKSGTKFNAKNYSLCVLANFLSVFCGLCVTIWTNIISFIIYYVVTYVSSLDIYGYYPVFFFGAVVCPLIFAITLVTLPGNFSHDSVRCNLNGRSAYIFLDAWYWIRIVSILINAAIFIRISIRLNYLTKLPQSGTDEVTEALTALVRRVKYYPIIQVFIRSGAAWNEFNNYQYETFASQLMNYICSPSTGACYFFLFLYMQPRAYMVFCSILRELVCCQKKKEEEEENMSSSRDSTYLDEQSRDSNLNDLDEEELERRINRYSVNPTQRENSLGISLSDIGSHKTSASANIIIEP